MNNSEWVNPLDKMQFAVVRSWLEKSELLWEEEADGFMIYWGGGVESSVWCWADFQRIKANSMIPINKIR